MKTEPLSIPSAIFWAVGYLGVMLVYTGLDVAVWRKWFAGNDETSSAPAAPQEPRSPSSTNPRIKISSTTGARRHTRSKLAAGDRCLDPLLERAFPKSEAAYQEALERLARSPLSGSVFIVCPLYSSKNRINI